MWKKKAKNFISQDKALSLFNEVYGLKARIFNYYQIRIGHEETNDFWDWYHTTGTLVRNSYEKGPLSCGIKLSAEDVAMYIKEKIYE